MLWLPQESRELLHAVGAGRNALGARCGLVAEAAGARAERRRKAVVRKLLVVPRLEERLDDRHRIVGRRRRVHDVLADVGDRAVRIHAQRAPSGMAGGRSGERLVPNHRLRAVVGALHVVERHDPRLPQIEHRAGGDRALEVIVARGQSGLQSVRNRPGEARREERHVEGRDGHLAVADRDELVRERRHDHGRRDGEVRGGVGDNLANRRELQDGRLGLRRSHGDLAREADVAAGRDGAVRIKGGKIDRLDQTRLGHGHDVAKRHHLLLEGQLPTAGDARRPRKTRGGSRGRRCREGGRHGGEWVDRGSTVATRELIELREASVRVDASRRLREEKAAVLRKHDRPLRRRHLDRVPARRVGRRRRLEAVAAAVAVDVGADGAAERTVECDASMVTAEVAMAAGRR